MVERIAWVALAGFGFGVVTTLVLEVVRWVLCQARRGRRG